MYAIPLLYIQQYFQLEENFQEEVSSFLNGLWEIVLILNGLNGLWEMLLIKLRKILSVLIFMIF